MTTAHIAAAPGDFAPDVLLPGDPRRAQRIAETFFDDPRLVTDVRGILGFTGSIGGRPISVLASGMGMPSVSIYATELARAFGVTRIVRTGTLGAMQEHVAIGDVVIASAAHTDSAMSELRIPGVHFSHAPSFALLRDAVAIATERGLPTHVGAVFTSDSFYGVRPETTAGLTAHGVLAVEMEAAGLYAVGAAEGIETLMVGTISDHVLREEEMTAQQRETTFVDMVTVALGSLGFTA